MLYIDCWFLFTVIGFIFLPGGCRIVFVNSVNYIKQLNSHGNSNDLDIKLSGNVFNED